MAYSYQTHLGRVCPRHIRILDPKRKTMVLSHPYMEDYVVFSARHGIRSETHLAERDQRYQKSHNDVSATWINLLVEKHAWLSAGLIWLPEASDTGRQVEFGDRQSDELSACPPSISLIL